MIENEEIASKSAALSAIEEQMEELVKLRGVLERLDYSKEAAIDVIAAAKDLTQKNAAIISAAESLTSAIDKIEIDKLNSILSENADMLSNIVSVQASAFQQFEKQLQSQNEYSVAHNTLLNNITTSVGRVNELVRDKTDTLRAEYDAHRMSHIASQKELEQLVKASQGILSELTRSSHRKMTFAIIIATILILAAQFIPVLLPIALSIL